MGYLKYNRRYYNNISNLKLLDSTYHLFAHKHRVLLLLFLSAPAQTKSAIKKKQGKTREAHKKKEEQSKNIVELKLKCQYGEDHHRPLN